MGIPSIHVYIQLAPQGISQQRLTQYTIPSVLNLESPFSYYLSSTPDNFDRWFVRRHVGGGFPLHEPQPHDVKRDRSIPISSVTPPTIWGNILRIQMALGPQ